jgi:ribosomal protein L44E
MSSRKFMCVERVEYKCSHCKKAGSIVEIFLHPDLLLLRGYCEGCRKFGISRVTDLTSLQSEFELIVPESSMEQ